MKILLINHFPLEGSGSGSYTINIAKSLTKKGNEVCIIMPENTTKIIKLNNIKIHPVYFKDKEKIKGQVNFNFPCMDTHPKSKKLFKKLTEKEIETYKNAFKKAIEEEIEEFNPDIIHAQHIWVIAALATEYKTPTIITSHGSELICYEENPKFQNEAKKACDSCKTVVAISKYNKEIIEKYFPKNTKKIKIILNGYDTKTFFPEKCFKKDILEQLGINKEYEKIVCFAGRLTKNKGLDILLEASKIYGNEKILTLIVGDGKAKKELQKIQKKLKIKNFVFVGNKKQDFLRKIYNISNVLTLPSRKESFGLVALEAIACGTPVVATKNGGLIDFVNTKVGILVENENVEELGKAIKYVLENENEFSKEYLIKYTKQNYSQDKLINKMIEEYKNILN